MLEVESDGSVLRLALARPGVRNALDEELIHLLLDRFRSVGPEVRAVVLTGAGSAFCAGADLSWMKRGLEASEDENYEDALQLAYLLQAIVECPAPVIARVNGHCFGGGCGLVAAADVVVCSDVALFAFSEVKLGLVPATISPYVMRRVGRGHSRALFVTGETFTAARALTIGLVHEVVPNDLLDVVVEQKIEGILKSGPRAIAGVKRLTNDPELSPEEAAHLLAATRASDEAREGISAFLEKRLPLYAEKRLQ